MGEKYKERYDGYTGEKRRTVKSFRVSTYAKEEFEKSGQWNFLESFVYEVIVGLLVQFYSCNFNHWKNE